MKKSLFYIFGFLFSFSVYAQDIKNIYEKVSPSLVTLRSVDVLGFGFFIDKDLVVTNYQVINKARMGSAKAILNTDQAIDVLGYVAADEELDLVILKVDYKEGVPLVLSSKSLIPQAKLYLFSNKVEEKINVYEGNFIEVKDFGNIKMIQIGASIITFNSGFPVLEKDGEVVGISVLSPVQDTNTNFAVPAEKIIELLARKSEYISEIKSLSPPPTIEINKQEKSELLKQFLNQGNAKLLAKDYKGAIDKFTSAIKLAPNDPDAYVFRGQAKYLLMQYKDALDDFNRAIDIEPSFAEAYDLRGIAKAELGDKTGACEDWIKSYELGFNEAFKLIKEFCDIEKN